MHKRHYYLIIFLFLLSISLNLFAQVELESEKRIKLIGIETGSIFYGSEFTEMEFVRKQDHLGYSSNVYDINTIYHWNLGVTAEIRSKNNNLGFITGLRFSSVNSSLGNSSSENNNEFFYFLFREEETSVEYLRILRMKQTSNYLSIPIEIRYLMINSQFVRLYCKASVETGYQMNTNSDITFLNAEMEIYESEIIDKFKDPNKILSNLYFSAGIKLGKEEDINVNAEAIFLSKMISKNNSVINKPNVGGGFRVNLQIPF